MIGRKPAVIGAGPEGIAGRRAKPETMAQLTASRTLVKSSPELWAECSDAASLARHFGAFGEIQITKLEPETAVAWEGEDVRGTVTLEPSGWGTRVVLTAVRQPGAEPVDTPLADEAQPELPLPEPVSPEPELPEAEFPEASQTVQEPEAPGPDESAGATRPGFWRRLFGGRRQATPPVRKARAPALSAQPMPPEPEPRPSEPAAAALLEALDSLGRAHHRPYSRG